MTQQSVVKINLLLLSIWLWFLMSYFGMSKTEYMGIDTNPYYNMTMWAMYFLAILYARLFISRHLFFNVVLTTLLFMVAYRIRYIPTDWFEAYLLKKDKNRTPLGWTFKYRFLDLAVMNVFLLAAFGIVRGMVPVKWRPAV